MYVNNVLTRFATCGSPVGGRVVEELPDIRSVSAASLGKNGLIRVSEAQYLRGSHTTFFQPLFQKVEKLSLNRAKYLKNNNFIYAQA